ncbi:glycosyltransferase family 2 protein [Acidianus manzaensis]|uniref:glycosyltransferase family 2 protein n=1 Tax=Acidianus manzaensis TaxID=282676 RepID=UPI00164FCF93|nr:glycosyltransferase family 2 protein [Acidianus manzaensis]
MRFSIIITAYNRKKYVLQAIKSVPKEAEIVLVNNFSYTNLDENNNIKVINLDNNIRNIGEFMAKGVENSSGDVICFLDDDDMFTEDKLSIISKYFSNNDIVMTYNSRILIDEKGNIIGEEVLPTKTIKPDLYGTKYLFLNRIFFNSSSMCIRRDLLEDKVVIMPKIIRLMDNFILLSAIESQGYIQILSDKLTYYRVHPSSSRPIYDNYHKFLEDRKKYFEDAIEDNDNMLRIFSREETRYAIECSKKMAFIQKKFFSIERNTTIINCKIFNFKTLMFINILSLISILFPSLPSKIYFRKYRNAH